VKRVDGRIDGAIQAKIHRTLFKHVGDEISYMPWLNVREEVKDPVHKSDPIRHSVRRFLKM